MNENIYIALEETLKEFMSLTDKELDDIGNDESNDGLFDVLAQMEDLFLKFNPIEQDITLTLKSICYDQEEKIYHTADNNNTYEFCLPTKGEFAWAA